MQIVVQVAYTDVSVPMLTSSLCQHHFSITLWPQCLSTLVLSQWSETSVIHSAGMWRSPPIQSAGSDCTSLKYMVFLHQKHPLPVHKRSCRARVGISFQRCQNSDSHHKHNTFLMGLSAVFQISCWAWLSVTYLYPDYPGLSTGRLDLIHSWLLMTK